MSTRNDRLFESFLPLDVLIAGFEDESKIAAFSDCGSGADAIYDALDESDRYAFEDENPALSVGNQNFTKLMIFEGMLKLAKLERLIPIVEQIVKNGKDRQKSIIALARTQHISYASSERKYHRGIEKLMKVVFAQ